MNRRLLNAQVLAGAMAIAEAAFSAPAISEYPNPRPMESIRPGNEKGEAPEIELGRGAGSMPPIPYRKNPKGYINEKGAEEFRRDHRHEITLGLGIKSVDFKNKSDNRISKILYDSTHAIFEYAFALRPTTLVGLKYSKLYTKAYVEYSDSVSGIYTDVDEYKLRGHEFGFHATEVFFGTIYLRGECQLTRLSYEKLSGGYNDQSCGALLMAGPNFGRFSLLFTLLGYSKVLDASTKGLDLESDYKASPHTTLPLGLRLSYMF